MTERLKALFAKIAAFFSRGNIRYTIFASFTISAAIVMLLTGVTFYLRFTEQLDNSIEEQNVIPVKQVKQSFVSVFLSVDELFLSIEDNLLSSYPDPAADGGDIDFSLALLHQSYDSSVFSIALFSRDAALLISQPELPDGGSLTILPDDGNYGDLISREDWFEAALARPGETLYFPPRVLVSRGQGNRLGAYSWVIPVSRAVNVGSADAPRLVVLLINLRYSVIKNICDGVSLPNNGYVYLVNGDGAIVYHPKYQLVLSGTALENNDISAGYSDGTVRESFAGQTRTLIIQSASHGWKVIGVIPDSSLVIEPQNIITLMIVFFFYLGVVTIVNSAISNRITDPLHKLEQSVLSLDHDSGDTRVYSGGSYEIQHLGQTIQKMVDQMRSLSDDVVKEQENKRKSELNALQAQINPHFLYNTLDIIIWMIEQGKPEDAVKLVTALARLFRISLSRGKNIIALSDEIDHVVSYLTIQEKRYKDKFSYTIDADSETLDLGIVKLVIQPLVENAIYHSMDYMDGDGAISIRSEIGGDGDLYITVSDNGLGMTKETVERLLTSEGPSSTRGSGIGLKNVNERMKLYFGPAYGVSIKSELDVGTSITLHAPAIPYEEAEERLNGAF
jgi:two-component system sensor histidine kinase YesM